MAMFRFNENGVMYSVHPGVTIEDVQKNCGSPALWEKRNLQHTENFSFRT